MRGWIPTVESNGAAHRVVWLGESANLYGEMISTSSSAPSGLKWLILEAQDPAKRSSWWTAHGQPVGEPSSGRLDRHEGS